jgi:uncharacterized protein YkwD
MLMSRPVVAAAVALTLLLFAAPAASAADDCEGAGASAGSATKRVLVRATLCLLNAERARHHLRPLRLNRRLSRGARRHSRAMVSKGFFSHTSLDGTTFLGRIKATGYLSGARSWNVGENIAYGSGSLSTPGEISRAWMNSAEHRANILSSAFRSIGIGIASGTPVGRGGGTYTTDFGRRS